MRVKTIDPADSRFRWAKRTFSGDDSCTDLSGQDVPPVSLWYKRVEDGGFSVSAIEWTAYQVLRGDESNWQSAVRMADSEVICSQGEQIRVFSKNFLGLTANEKRFQFDMLSEQSKDNAVAMLHLNRFRPFLDLDNLESYSDNPDVLDLIRILIGQQVSGPFERKVSVQKMLSLSTADPQRWRVAAEELRSCNPRLTKLAPSLLDRIVYYDRESPMRLADRKWFNRRYAFRLVHCRLVEQLHSQITPVHFIAASFVFFLMVAIAGWISREQGSSSPNVSSTTRTSPRTSFSPSRNLPSGRSEKEEFAEILSTLREAEEQKEALRKLIVPPTETKNAINLLPTAEQAALYKKLQKAWAKIALQRGTDGLNSIETTIRWDAESQSIEPHVLTHGLRLFKSWRREFGDAIATKADSRINNELTSKKSGDSIPNRVKTELESGPNE